RSLPGWRAQAWSACAGRPGSARVRGCAKRCAVRQAHVEHRGGARAWRKGLRLTDEGSTFKSSDGVEVIRVPRHASPLSAVMHVVPLQLLAYHVALLLARNIDKPRNLAKSVTVQ